MIKTFHALLFFNLFYSTLIAQNNLNNSFSFESLPREEKFWTIRSVQGGVNADNKYFMQGKQSWCLTGFNKGFHSYIYSYFNLPISGVSIELSVYSKTTILNTAWLKIWCLDEDENLLKKDSISIVNSGDWRKFSLRFEVQETKKLYIEIETKSNDDLAYDPKAIQKLNIDNMVLKINGKEIKIDSSVTEKEEADYIANGITNDSVNYNDIGSVMDFENSKVLALGESVHGSDNIQYAAYEIIKHQIKYKNCRLVLLELNFELGMWLNEFILNDVHEENIEKRMVLYNYNYSRLMDMLKWIKDYNIKHKEKVMISGFDENIIYTNLQGFDHLKDLIKSQKINQDSIQPFYNYYANRNYEKAKEYIHENRFFCELDEYKRKCITRALDLRQKKIHPVPSLIEGDREFVQFVNAKFAIDSLLKDSSKAVIFAHLAHVNKKNVFTGRIYIPSFGNYLDQHYKKEYFVTALLVGEGTISNTDSSGNWAMLPLIRPLNGSIEKVLTNLNRSFIYMRTSDLNSVNCGRYIGIDPMKEQFYPYSHKNRFNAILFIQHSDGYSLPSNWPKTKDERIIYIENQRAINGVKPLFN